MNSKSMIFWLIIVCGFSVSLYFSDLESPSIIFSTVSPIVCGVFILAGILKIGGVSGFRDTDEIKAPGGNTSGWFGGDGGGDGGC